MLLYRVYGRIPGVSGGEAGSAEYIHRPQGRGRWDNPALYDSRYLSTSPEGAIAETFGNLDHWSEEMFVRAYLPGGRMVLGVFETPDDLSLCDLDDANNLLAFGMKPSQVVIRNPAYTQARAAAVFADGLRAGLSWWSFHRPFWTNVMLWSTPAAPAPLVSVSVTELDLGHPAVMSARKALAKPIA